MTIKRNGIEIELTEAEMRQAYEELHERYNREDITNNICPDWVIPSIPESVISNPEFIDDCAEAYQQWQDEDDSWHRLVRNAVIETAHEWEKNGRYA